MSVKYKEIPLSFYQWIHSRIFKNSFRGYIKEEQIFLIFRMHFNIPKRMCPLIIKELELLGLIKKKDGYFKVEKAEENEILKELENKLLYKNLK